MEPPSPYEPVGPTNVSSIIGIAQDFFRSRLEGNGDMPLVEDDDLPVKQRFPKPRLPPNGKITSPRKRPLREQQQMAKKKRKLDEEAAKLAQKPIGKLKLEPPERSINVAEPEKDDGSAVGMMSPESLVV
jgi:transcriptional activator SPT7